MNKLGYQPGTVIQASDRQYLVLPSGSWKRLTKEQEVGSDFEKFYALQRPEIPHAINGISTRTGQKCYCAPCRRWRQEQAAPIKETNENSRPQENS